MRRKSSRSTAKASPEKPAEPTRRSRRHSKRRKRSSSGSSDEDSNDVPLQALVVSKTPEVQKDPDMSLVEPLVEEPVWKVTPSAAPSGEIQKLKICLTRPVMSSPEKTEPTTRRRRNKSGHEEDVTSSEDVVAPPRKTRHRGSVGKTLDESGVELEEQEEKKGKGKSKSKTKSKSEKSQDIQEIRDRTESEISENVQVTPQSPQAAIDIRVDNETVSNNENESVINEESNSVSQTSEISDATQEEITEQKCVNETTSKTSSDLDKSVAQVNESTVEEPITISSESCSPEVTEQSYQETELEGANRESLRQSDNSESLYRTEPKSVEDVQTAVEAPKGGENLEEAPEGAREEVEASEPVVVEASDEQAASDQPTNEQEEVPTEVVNENDLEEPKQSSPVLVEETEENANLAEELSGKEVEVDEVQEHVDTNVEQTEEVVEKVEQVEDVQEQQNEEDKNEIEDLQKSASDESKSGGNSSDEADKEDGDNQVLILQSKEVIEDSSMKSLATDNKQPSDEESAPIKSSKVIINLDRTSITDKKEVTRRRKWGSSSVGLEFIKPQIRNIDIETIKQFCPNLQFLEESQVKIETTDRRKSVENDRKASRKVTIDHKTNDSEHLRLDTQTSFNSSEINESDEQEVDNSNIIAMNRKISIVDDTASKLKPPPSPSKNAVSPILFISNLVRPFTLKQLKELLERTGKITDNGFWTDRIKSKCYVCYESNEEAEATRNALHGVHWPIGNGKKLVIEYSTEQDMERARNPTPPPVIPLIPVTDSENIENQSSTKKPKLVEEDTYPKEQEVKKVEKRVREWDIGKEDMQQRLRSRSRELDGRHDRHQRNDRHKHKRTPSPTEDFISRKQRKKEEEIPQKLMDDLFQKTKATPSIYWLPLTPEEISTKQQQRLLRMAEHKRRLEESNRNRGEYGRGVPYRRRYN